MVRPDDTGPVDAPEVASTRVSLNGPLPLDVLSTLMQIVGCTYPGTMIGAPRGSEALVLLIPDATRPQSDVAVPAAEVAQFGPGLLSLKTPEEFGLLFAGLIEAEFEAYPEAVNYLEYPFLRSDSGVRYAMTFRRHAGKTPHELRVAAEEKLAQATRELAAAKARIQELEEAQRAE